MLERTRLMGQGVTASKPGVLAVVDAKPKVVIAFVALSLALFLVGMGLAPAQRAYADNGTGEVALKAGDIATQVHPEGLAVGAESAQPKLNKTKVTTRSGITTPLGVKNAKGKTVTWSSSNTKIATVDKDGYVLARKTGKATITANVAGKKLKCKFNVSEQMVVPAKKSATLKMKYVKDGDTYKIKSAPKMNIKVTCTRWASTDISCKSSNSSVAEVKWNSYRKQQDYSTMTYGITVTGHKPGKAIITLTNTFNNEKTKIKVTVKPAYGVTVDPGNSLVEHFAKDSKGYYVKEFFVPIKVTNKTGHTVQIASGAGIYSPSGTSTDLHGMYLFTDLTDFSDASDSSALGIYSVNNYMIRVDGHPVYLKNGQSKLIYGYIGETEMPITKNSTVALGILDKGKEKLCYADYTGNVIMLIPQN